MRRENLERLHPQFKPRKQFKVWIIVLIFIFGCKLQQVFSFLLNSTNLSSMESILFLEDYLTLQIFLSRLMAGRGRGLAPEDVPIQGGRSKPRIAHSGDQSI